MAQRMAPTSIALRPTAVAVLLTLPMAALPPNAMMAQGRSETIVSEADIARTRVTLVTLEDRFTKVKATGPKDRKTLEGGRQLLGWSDAFLIPVFTQPTDSVSFFYFRIIYSGLEWVFLNGSLQFLVDGVDRYELVGPGSDREREVGACMSGVGCNVVEATRIPVGRDVLERLAEAHSVEVRLLGSRRSLERWFKREHFAQIRAVLTKADSMTP